MVCSTGNRITSSDGKAVRDRSTRQLHSFLSALFLFASKCAFLMKKLNLLGKTFICADAPAILQGRVCKQLSVGSETVVKFRPV